MSREILCWEFLKNECRFGIQLHLLTENACMVSDNWKKKNITAVTATWKAYLREKKIVTYLYQ